MHACPNITGMTLTAANFWHTRVWRYEVSHTFKKENSRQTVKFFENEKSYMAWGPRKSSRPLPHPPPPSQTLNPNPDSNPYVITITIRLIEIVIATMCYTREVNSHTLYSVFITGDFIDKKTCRTHAVQATSTRLIGKNKIPPSPQKGKSSLCKK